MKIYRIKNWGVHYENNRTRAMAEMRWIPVPNKHDGDGYTALVEGDDGAALLGCWLVIIQVASKCRIRGTLLRDGDKPHTAATISRVTRLPEHLIQKCLDKASSEEVGWLEVLDVVDGEIVAGWCRENVKRVLDSGRQPTIEGNGREEKRMEGNAPPLFEIPSAGEVIAFGASQLQNQIPEDYCQNFYSKLTEENGWIKNGKLLEWKIRLPRYWESDKHTWFRKRKNRNPLSDPFVVGGNGL